MYHEQPMKPATVEAELVAAQATLRQALQDLATAGQERDAARRADRDAERALDRPARTRKRAKRPSRSWNASGSGRWASGTSTRSRGRTPTRKGEPCRRASICRTSGPTCGRSCSTPRPTYLWSDAVLTTTILDAVREHSFLFPRTSLQANDVTAGQQTITLSPSNSQ